MAKFRSLSDALGVEDPTLKPGDPVPDPPDPAELAADEDFNVRQFCLSILNSKQYRESIQRRILCDDLPASTEQMLWHYGVGKPAEVMELKGEIAVTRVVREVIDVVEATKKAKNEQPRDVVH